MSRASINFQLLASELNNYITSFVPRWIPGGTQKGNEYRSASIYGGQGNSFSINLSTGKWADFANAEHKGSDLISLYATIHNVKNSEAAAALADLIGFQETTNTTERLPNLIHSRFGKPTDHWIYRNKRGFPVALVVRYDPPHEKKQFSQWHFNQSEQKWIPKSIPDSRPLYKLDQLDRNPSLPVVVCEGEKSCDAAQKLFGDTHITTCWMGGSQALNKTDLSPLYNRKIILWPDADEPGISAMSKLSKKIVLHASTLAIINPLESDPSGFDAADLLENPAQFYEYIHTRMQIIKATPIETHPASEPSGENAPNSVGVAPLNTALPYTEQDQELAVLTDSRILVKWQDLGLMMKSETKVYQNESNVLKILNSSDKTIGTAYYDEFFKSFMSTFSVTVPEPFNDITFIRFKLLLQTAYGFGDITTAAVEAALKYYASHTVKNSVADYLRELKWDGVPRIDTFFNDVYGATEGEYSKAVSRIFWLSLAARILDPGCKADIMVILEGDQGIQKTSSLEEIASIMGQNFYSTAGKDPRNKDFYIGLQGKTIVEMGEIEALIINSDEIIKEMLSTRIDNYRIPHAKTSTPNSRTNIFVGTTNKTNYLRDETGARRFLPIFCKSVNMGLLRENKLQYYAEATHRKLKGEDHWLFPKELAKEQTDFRMEIDDPWYDDVAFFCRDLRFVKITDVLDICLGISDRRFHTKKESNRISKILKKIGYTNISKRIDSEVIKIWEHSDVKNRVNSSWEKRLKTPELPVTYHR